MLRRFEAGVRMLKFGSLPLIEGEDLFLEVTFDLTGCVIQIRPNTIFCGSCCPLFCENRAQMALRSQNVTDLCCINNQTSTEMLFLHRSRGLIITVFFIQRTLVSFFLLNLRQALFRKLFYFIY